MPGDEYRPTPEMLAVLDELGEPMNPESTPKKRFDAVRQAVDAITHGRESLGLGIRAVLRTHKFSEPGDSGPDLIIAVGNALLSAKCEGFAEGVEAAFDKMKEAFRTFHIVEPSNPYKVESESKNGEGSQVVQETTEEDAG